MREEKRLSNVRSRVINRRTIVSHGNETNVVILHIIIDSNL